ncbi:MAG: molybdopterin-dependent oxidoreductase, partial [Anaerolineales bacterium]
IYQPLTRGGKGNNAEVIGKEQAITRVAELIKGAKRVIGIGSPRASLEANYALKTLVGADDFYFGLSENDDRLLRLGLEILKRGPAHSPSLREFDESDVVLVLGEDLTNTAPMMALFLRQLVHRKASQVAEKFDIPEWNDIAIREIIQHEKESLYIAAPTATKLDDIARQTFQAAPDDIARLGYAIAHALDADAPAVEGLPESADRLAGEIAKDLSGANRPLIISGTSCGSPQVMQAAANIAWALCGEGHCADLAFTVPEPNSVGLGLLGGGTLQEAFQAVSDNQVDVVVVLENDLYRRADAGAVDKFLDAAPRVIALDYLENATNLQADIVLPAAAFAEANSTWVNNEGRAQRAYQVYVPKPDVMGSWRWLREVLIKTNQLTDDSWNTIDEVLSTLAEQAPLLAPVEYIAPPASFRITGQKIPRQAQRFSGRT